MSVETFFGLYQLVRPEGPDIYLIGKKKSVFKKTGKKILVGKKISHQVKI